MQQLSSREPGRSRSKAYMVIRAGSAACARGMQRRMHSAAAQGHGVQSDSWAAALLCCRYGFIILDGNGTLFGTLSGNTRETLHKFQVDLPKKHGRGGQSALRFARLRLEKRHNYVRKVGCCWSSVGAVLAADRAACQVLAGTIVTMLTQPAAGACRAGGRAGSAVLHHQ